LFSYLEDPKDGQKEYYERIGGSLGQYFSDNNARETRTIQGIFAFNFYRPGVKIISTKDLITDRYSTDNVQRIAYYDGSLPWSWNLQAANPQASGENVPPTDSLKTTRRAFINEYDGEFTLDFADRNEKDGLFTRYYERLDQRYKDQKILEVDLIIDAAFLSSLYFLTGKDLRALYYVGIDGVKGYYQMIEAEQIRGELFRAMLIQDSETFVEPEPPTPEPPDYPENALYTPEQVTEMITIDGYIPVASASELDALRNSGNRTMGEGSPWEGTYNTGLDKKYVQVDNVDLNTFYQWGSIGTQENMFSGTYDGNELNIENMNQNTSVSAPNGLFRNLYQGVLKNIKIHGYIENASSLGAGLLCGFTGLDSVVDNCHATEL
jgi:hypothetical protein